MSFRLETFIAFRYLKSRRDESFISISSLFSFLGITIGVATLIVVMSVMNGFRYELVNKIVGINGHIILYLNGNSENKHSKVSNDIEALEEVESVSKEVEMHAMISSTSNSSGILVKGINKVDLFERSSISNGLIKGNLSNFDQNSIVIGTRLASFLRVGIDEKITLITASSTTTPFGNIPNTLEFVVKGIFDVGMYNFDRNIAFIPKELSTRLIGKNIDYASHIEIFLSDLKYLNKAAFNIDKLVGNNGKIFTWESIHKELFNALKIEKKVMFLILSLIIFVAAFNLISSIIMIVKDKERGIGILRSLGFTKIEILRIFIFIGSFVGILGTILGTILGVLVTINIARIQLFLEGLLGGSLFAAEVYFFNIIPSKIDITEIISIISVSLTLSLVSTIYPAWRASKIEPANILRYE